MKERNPEVPHCQQCGKPIAGAQRSTRKFCSSICRQQNYRNRVKK